MRIRHSRPTRDFLQVPNATVRDDRLSHMARGILAELLSRPDGWAATADDMWRASVAARGKASPGRRVFRAAFAELKEHGYLTSDRERQKNGQSVTALTLTDISPAQTGVPHAGTSVRPAKSGVSAGETDVPHGGTPVSPANVPHAGTSVPPGETNVLPAHTDVPPTGTPVPPAETGITAGRTDVPHAGTSNTEHGKTNTGRKNTTTSPPVAAAPPRDYHLTAFGAFWTNYPKKRAREEAKKAWIAAIERGADPQHMVTAAADYARERHGEDPRYTKYPATWLDKGCYDDEPDPAPGKPQLRAVSGGHTPYQPPTDHSVYENGFHA